MPLDGHPARNIAGGRRHRPVGQFYSLKNGCAAPWESRNELHAIYHAEVSTDVVSYRAQPHTLKFVINGKMRVYTPDREDLLASGQRRIVEVKDAFEEQADPDYDEKLDHARAVYRLIGAEFCIETRSKIEAGPLFESVELIQSFRRTAVTTNDLLLINQVFVGEQALPLERVRSLFSSAPLGFAKLSAMMVRRMITMDLTSKLGPDTAVRLIRAQ